MEPQVNLDNIYKHSEDVVAREVAGEFIIIPIAAGIGDLEDEIFALNESGKSIWDKLSSGKTLRSVASELSGEFDGPLADIEKDCVGLVRELLKRRIVIDKGNG